MAPGPSENCLTLVFALDHGRPFNVEGTEYSGSDSVSGTPRRESIMTDA